MKIIMLNTRTNDEKVVYYKKFWNREDVSRPLIGFDVGGFFSFKRFPTLASIPDGAKLSPDMLAPSGYLEAYTNFQQHSAQVDDDLIKGVSPIPAMAWLEAMVGCGVRISQESASMWVEDRHASWEDLGNLHIAENDPWLWAYREFLAALTRQAEGRYPVGLPILRGVTDLLGALRGHDQSLMDGLDEPALTQQVALRCADALIDLTQQHYEEVDAYLGGYFVEQFGLWAPGKIARLQEDASAIYSPRLYRKLIQECDRRIAAAFPYSVIHLHPSSLFLLDDFLAIEEIDVIQINKDVGSLSVEEMVPWLQKVQACERCLLIRGALEPGDLRLIARHLSPKGLLVQIVVDRVESVPEYQAIAGTCW